MLSLQHPITRFLSRYMFPNTQMEYEKQLHWLKVADNKRRLYLLKQKIMWDIQDHEDYRFWSFRKSPAEEIIKIRQSLDRRELDV